MEEEQEYYFAIHDHEKKFGFIVYASESYKLSEIDIINLIKILLVERRSRDIGRRILAMYKDANEHKPEETIEKLKKIGITEDEKIEPIKSKAKTK
jgi:hypothetical protein